MPNLPSITGQPIAYCLSAFPSIPGRSVNDRDDVLEAISSGGWDITELTPSYISPNGVEMLPQARLQPFEIINVTQDSFKVALTTKAQQPYSHQYRQILPGESLLDTFVFNINPFSTLAFIYSSAEDKEVIVPLRFKYRPEGLAATSLSSVVVPLQRFV